MAERDRNAERAFARARTQVHTLVETLEAIVRRDPEQEVRGIAIGALDAVLSAARDVLQDHHVIDKISDVISAEVVAEGEPVRAVDALLVARQIAAALPYVQPTGLGLLFQRQRRLSL